MVDDYRCWIGDCHWRVVEHEVDVADTADAAGNDDHCCSVDGVVAVGADVDKKDSFAIESYHDYHTPSHPAYYYHYSNWNVCSVTHCH